MNSIHNNNSENSENSSGNKNFSHGNRGYGHPGIVLQDTVQDHIKVKRSGGHGSQGHSDPKS